MMKIVVIGGTGLIGSKLVANLKQDGHAVVSASPRSGVDTMSGDGLAWALEGADVVVDVTNTHAYEAGGALEFFTTSTHNILAAESEADVSHHVVLSIVGAERLSESPYVRGKIAQEELIQDSPIPYTIVQATQFFEFVRDIADAASKDGAVRLGHAMIQPIAADEVAVALAEICQGAPLNGIVEVAGPESFLIDQFIRHGLLALGEPRPVVADRKGRFFGADLHDRILLPAQGALLGRLRFQEWLAQSERGGAAIRPRSPGPRAAR